MSRTISTICLCILSFFLIDCSRKEKKLTLDDLLKNKYRNLASYTFDREADLSDRIAEVPTFVLKKLKEWDGRDDYMPHQLSQKDLSAVKSAFKNLSPLSRKIARERLVQVYFVKNFMGSGWTDWLVNEKGEIFCYMAFPDSVLKKNVSQLITAKELSCYKKSKDYSLAINCGKEYNGFLYILLHETTHIVDYVKNINPYVEKEIFTYLNKTPEMNKDFIKGVWKTDNTPLTAYNFPERTLITFYGFNKGPKLELSRAKHMYTALSRTPFVSLYGSQYWFEDLAEFVAFYHMHIKMGLPYEINVYHGNDLIYVYEPMKSKLVQSRFPLMDEWYGEN